MEKQEVLERLCALTNRVADREFDHITSADCFCGKNPLSNTSINTFQFSPKVIEFIETAVDLCLKK